MALLFLVFLTAAAVAIQPHSLDIATRLPENADGLQLAWILKMACGGLSHPGDMFAGNMFYPDPSPLLYSEPLVGLAIQVAPLCALGLDHVTLFNATFMILLAMSALGAWLLAREIGTGPEAALVAAAVFAFTSANYDSSARLQIVASQWTPLVLLFAIRFARGGRLREAVGMGGAFAMQALSCTYYEMFLGLLLLLSAPLWVTLFGGWANARRRLPGVAAAVFVSAALVVPLNLAQKRHLDPVIATRPQAHEVSPSFFTEVLETNLIYGSVLGRTRPAYDAMYFPGLLPLVLAALFLALSARDFKKRPWKESGLRPVVFIGAAAFVLSLGASISTPWGDIPGPMALFSGLPGLGQARVPSRFLMFTRLTLAVLAAAGAARLFGLLRLKRWRWASVLAVVCYLEHFSVPLDTWTVPARDQLPKAYAWLEQSGRNLGPILEFPPALQRLRREEATWLHLAAFHGLPMANGFGSFRPPWHEFVMEAALQTPDQRLLSILNQIGVRAIVVHPRPRGLPEVDRATRALLDFATGHPEQLPLVASFSDAQSWEGIWSRLGDEKIFQVPQGPPPAPAPVGPAIDRAGWSCRSTEPRCEQALDGDLESFLESVEVQHPGQNVKIRFAGPERIHAVSIDLGRIPEGFPRDPVIRLLIEAEWREVDARLDVATMLSQMMARSTNPRMVWTFPETVADGFEIRLRSGGQGFRELFIPELNAHRAVGRTDPGRPPQSP